MGKIPTGTWPTPQNEKLPYLKFRLGTYVPFLRAYNPSVRARNCDRYGRNLQLNFSYLRLEKREKFATRFCLN